MQRRFGERAEIVYFDVSKSDARSEHAEVLDAIRDAGLVYPVTLIGETVVSEGAVSYPAILRAVDTMLAEQTAPAGHAG
jgi:disulfide oxidoreductase YuzD